ncbi:MAG: pyridoxine 5'-phosphate synthase [Planctomycetes bacterium]|nr:pyridoxine 5'-phosphate synthase [Planctomycetota bacterium]MCW8134538.1 pyridoxine 5'-phosphate synthase [Planctomycetota bacterium]
MVLLGVNIDHVATVRNARGGTEPDPVAAALAAEAAGADSIVCHLREDRRHIRDPDVHELLRRISTSLQLEMALSDDVINVALKANPPEIMVVPERRAELTTEGGFDCVNHASRLADAIKRFRDAGIGVSVFIDPDASQVRKAHELGAHTIELHTGPYSHADTTRIGPELDRLETAYRLGCELGLEVHAGHGLNYGNIRGLLQRVPVAKVNIGHSIISRAVFTGIGSAVAEMKALAGL